MSMTNILSRLFQDGTGNKLQQQILPPIPSDLLPSIPINLLPQEELDARAATAAAPSDKYIDISFNSNKWTAIDTGYVNFDAIPSGSRIYLQVQIFPEDAQNTDDNEFFINNLFIASNSGDHVINVVFVRKGQIVKLVSEYVSSWKYIRFIYANGNAPE